MKLLRCFGVFHLGQCRTFWKINMNMCEIAPEFMPCLLSSLCLCMNCWLTRKWLIALPPYSLDLVSCDLFMFPKLKMALKGGRFNDITIVLGKLRDAFVEIWAVLFTECFEWWHNYWACCIKFQGDYFEGAALNWRWVLCRTKFSLEIDHMTYCIYCIQSGKHLSTLHIAETCQKVEGLISNGIFSCWTDTWKVSEYCF